MVRVLIIEDSLDDMDLVVYHLEKYGYELQLQRVETKEEMKSAMDAHEWDIIISDHMLPNFNSVEALIIRNEVDPNIPFILVSDKIGEEHAVEVMRLGCNDYVLKNNLIHIGEVIRRELQEAKIRRYNERYVQELTVTHDALQVSEEKYRNLVDNSLDYIFSFDMKYCFTAVNNTLCKAFKLNENEIVGKSLHDLTFMGDFRKEWMDLLNQAYDTGQVVVKEHQNSSLDKTFDCRIYPLYEENGILIGATGTCRDISEIKEYEQHIYKLAYFDLLTGLPNRTHLLKTLDRIISEPLVGDRTSALILLNLDDFKKINDTLGHTFGDELLQYMAFSISALVSENGSVYRIGGNTFAVLLDPIQASEIIEIADRLHDMFSTPWDINNHKIVLTASFGISVYPYDGITVYELISNADTALNKAKMLRKNNIQVFNAAMKEEMLQRIQIENGLRSALENDEFVLHYQPQYDTSRTTIRGIEVLIRWNNPKLGFIAPLDFIGVAEETGLIIPIGEWVLRKACEKNKEWQDLGFPKMIIGVNISPIQLRQKDFPSLLKKILEESSLEPQFLELEITENVMIDSLATISVLNEIRDLGIRISLDDFGTGYSSLNYLKILPLDSLKIDKSFIEGLNKESIEKTIVGSIISLVHKLKLDVVAEGVETKEQLQYLEECGSNYVQGYLFSRPLSEQDLLRLLQ